MASSYSLDLRERIVRFVTEGRSRRQAARHFRISESCAVKLLARWRDSGTAAPRRRGRPPGRGKLAPHRGFLMDRLAAQPDITMPELAAALAAERGIEVSPASLSRFLCAQGITYKKSVGGRRAKA